MTEIDIESVERRLLAAEIGVRSHPSRSREIIRGVRKEIEDIDMTRYRGETCPSCGAQELGYDLVHAGKILEGEQDKNQEHQ